MKPSPPLMLQLRLFLRRHPRLRPLVFYLLAWEVFDYSIWQVIRQRRVYRLVVDVIRYVDQAEDRRSEAARRDPSAR